MPEKIFGEDWRRRFPSLAHASGKTFVGVATVVAGCAIWLAEALEVRGAWVLVFAAGVAGVLYCLHRFALNKALAQLVARVEGEIAHASNETSSAANPGAAFVAPDGPQADAVTARLREFIERQSESLHTVRQEVAYFRRLAEDIHDLEAFFDENGHLHWVGPSIVQLTGYAPEACYAAPDALTLWIYSKDLPVVRDCVERVRLGELVEEIEVRVQRKDGSLYWCSCKWYPYYGASSELTGLRLSLKDIERRKQAELKLLETVAALRRTQALKEHYLHRSDEERMRLSALLDIVNLGILFVGRDRRVVYANQPACDMWRVGDRNGIIGTRDVTLIDLTANSRADDDAYRAHVAEVIPLRGQSVPYEIRFKDGRVIRELSARVQSSLEDRTIGRVWIYEDVTEALETKNRLIQLAERDPLTGLFNRRRFHEELDRQIAQAHREGEQIGLLCFDLDGFKSVNDTLGHQAGDEVLMAVAREIGGAVRRNELFFRLGGDEFAILVSHASVESTTHLASRIVERAERMKMNFEAGAAHVTMSVGIALSPIHASHPEGLMLAADRAMYQAKAQGKNRWAMAQRDAVEPKRTDDDAEIERNG